MKKLTQEIAVARLHEKHPQIIFCSFIYHNNTTKIPCKCSVCGYEWQAQYNNLVQGQGCIACKKNIFHSSEEALDFLRKKFPHIDFVPFEYINQRTRVYGKCKNCGSYLNFGKGTSFQSMSQNQWGCRQCHVNELKKTRSLSQQEVESRLYSLHKNISIKPFDYKNQRTRIFCRCAICGHEWSPTVAQMIKVKSDGIPAHSCEKCIRKKNGLKRRIDASFIINNLVQKHPDLDFSEFTYHGSHVAGWVTCKKCRRKFLSTYDRMYRAGSGCNYCRHIEGFEKQKIPVDAALKNMKNANKDIDFSFFEYKNSRIPGICKCLICDNEWMASYHSIVNNGSGCPKCNSSKGEKQVAAILNGLNISYIPQYKFEKCKIVRNMPFDFYIPEYNICVEVQGGQHFRPVQWFGGKKGFEKTLERDKTKLSYCEENGIRLILVNYDLGTMHDGCVDISDFEQYMQEILHS